MTSSLPEIKNLDDLLSKSLQRNVKILKQDSKLLTAPGENYGSIMIALAVTIEDENKVQEDLNLVAKLIPTNEYLREMFQVNISFVKEFSVYTKIVPAMRQLEDEYSVIENRASDLFCKCYGGRKNLKTENDVVDDDAVLLLENLKTSGYINGDRLKGFDYDTAVLVLKDLAKFHATPIALKLLKPDVFKQAISATLNVKHEQQKSSPESIQKVAKGFLEILLGDGDNHDESYATKVEKYLQDILHEISYQSDSNKPFVTFGHNDFWVNNLMVHLNENSKADGLKIVDFQTPESRTLVSDLLFFIFSSIAPDVLYGSEDNLLKIYYDSFINCLKDFKINDLDDYSWDAFKTEVKEQAFTVFNQILIMYKIILMERGEISDINDFSEDNFNDFTKVTENCKSRMKKTFELFIEKGWITL